MKTSTVDVGARVSVPSVEGVEPRLEAIPGVELRTQPPASPSTR